MFLETLILIFVNTENLCTSDEFLVSYILNLFRFSYFFFVDFKKKKNPTSLGNGFKTCFKISYLLKH